MRAHGKPLFCDSGEWRRGESEVEGIQVLVHETGCETRYVDEATGEPIPSEEYQRQAEAKASPPLWKFGGRLGDWIGERNTRTGEIRARNEVTGEVVTQRRDSRNELA